MSPKHDLTVISFFFFSFHIVIILAAIMITYTILVFFMLEKGNIENNMKHMCGVKCP